MPDRDREYVEFVEASSTSLRRTAYLICGGDPHRADDVVQEALYRLYLRWDRVDRGGNLLGYARRTVINAALDTHHRPWRREVPTDTVPERAVPRRDDAEHASRDELLTVLAGLPPRQRACVVLRYYLDLSIEQTADLLGCSTGNVKSQSARGLEALRHAMNDAPSATGDPR
jgi:RNA polymerase sigma-70 factor (sigma-E family)